MHDPEMIVPGAAYRDVGCLFRMPTTILSDRYQPLTTLTTPRYRIVSLAERDMQPFMSVRTRQDLVKIMKSLDQVQTHWIKSSVEVASDVLRASSFTTSLSHHLELPPHTSNPTIMNASMGSLKLLRRLPRLTLGARHGGRYDTIFITPDSGNWTLRFSLASHLFTQVSKMTKKIMCCRVTLDDDA